MKIYSTIKGRLVGNRKRVGLEQKEIEWLREFMSKRGNPLKLKTATRVHQDTVNNGLSINSYEYHVAVRLRQFIKQQND